MKLRVGLGYDVHQLKENCPLIIGGVIIPHHKGAFGHSDADVLLHAICDALLGAASLRDIGYQFPDTSEKYKGIDSRILLKEVFQLIKKKAYSINNIDSTVCLQTPKISTYIEDMKRNISELLDIDMDDVSIKATTTEKLGFVGQEKGISAYAVVLISK